MSHANAGLLSAYNSLTDKHLAGYFNNTRIRRHLQRAGLITRSGTIVPDKEYRQKLMRRDHQRHVRECLAQAIFHKVLDIERHHQIQIKRKLEDFARKERVHKIKAECSKRHDEDTMPMISPRPPSGPKNSHTRNSIPEAEQSESTESPASSRPNTAPGKMHRPVRLRPLHSNSTTASTRRASHCCRHKDSSDDGESCFCSTLDKDTMKVVTMPEFSSGVSPYRLPVINNYVTPVPPPAKRKERSFRAAPRGRTRGRSLRPTTAPNGPAGTRDSGFHKTTIHSNVSVTMTFYGKAVHLTNDAIDLRDEVKVFQQHCGGENVCVYRGKLMEGESFQFVSRRHLGFPFSLTFFLNGLQVDRLSSCCEFRHRKGSRLGGKQGHFGFISVDGASPCYKCIIAMGMDKKPTPPPKRPKDAETGSPAGTIPAKEEDVTQDSQAPAGETYSQEQEQEEEEAMVTEAKEEPAEEAQDDYEEDFEADDERGDEETEEAKAETVTNSAPPSPTKEGKDSHTDSQEAEEEDHHESKDDIKAKDSDGKPGKEDEAGEKNSPSSSSGSVSLFSSNRQQEPESEGEEVKEAIEDNRVSLSSKSVDRGESRDADRSGQNFEAGERGDTTSPAAGEELPEEHLEAEAAGEVEVQSTAHSPLEDKEDPVPAPVEGSEQVEQDSGETEPPRAKSVQEIIATAITKEAQDSSEPELSDTTTDEDEESVTAVDSTQQLNHTSEGAEEAAAAVLSLQQPAEREEGSNEDKAVNSDEAAADSAVEQAEGEEPEKANTEVASLQEEQETGGKPEPDPEIEEASADKEGDGSETGAGEPQTTATASETQAESEEKAQEGRENVEAGIPETEQTGEGAETGAGEPETPAPASETQAEPEEMAQESGEKEEAGNSETDQTGAEKAEETVSEEAGAKAGEEDGKEPDSEAIEALAQMLESTMLVATDGKTEEGEIPAGKSDSGAEEESKQEEGEAEEKVADGTAVTEADDPDETTESHVEKHRVIEEDTGEEEEAVARDDGTEERVEDAPTGADTAAEESSGPTETTDVNQDSKEVEEETKEEEEKIETEAEGAQKVEEGKDETEGKITEPGEGTEEMAEAVKDEAGEVDEVGETDNGNEQAKQDEGDKDAPSEEAETKVEDAGSANDGKQAAEESNGATDDSGETGELNENEEIVVKEIMDETETENKESVVEEERNETSNESMNGVEKAETSQEVETEVKENETTEQQIDGEINVKKEDVETVSEEVEEIQASVGEPDPKDEEGDNIKPEPETEIQQPKSEDDEDESKSQVTVEEPEANKVPDAAEKEDPAEVGETSVGEEAVKGEDNPEETHAKNEETDAKDGVAVRDTESEGEVKESQVDVRDTETESKQEEEEETPVEAEPKCEAVDKTEEEQTTAEKAESASSPTEMEITSTTVEEVKTLPDESQEKTEGTTLEADQAGAPAEERVAEREDTVGQSEGEEAAESTTPSETVAVSEKTETESMTVNEAEESEIQNTEAEEQAEKQEAANDMSDENEKDSETELEMSGDGTVVKDDTGSKDEDQQIKAEEEIKAESKMEVSKAESEEKEAQLEESADDAKELGAAAAVKSDITETEHDLKADDLIGGLAQEFDHPHKAPDEEIQGVDQSVTECIVEELKAEMEQAGIDMDMKDSHDQVNLPSSSDDTEKRAEASETTGNEGVGILSNLGNAKVEMKGKTEESMSDGAEDKSEEDVKKNDDANETTEAREATCDPESEFQPVKSDVGLHNKSSNSGREDGASGEEIKSEADDDVESQVAEEDPVTSVADVHQVPEYFETSHEVSDDIKDSPLSERGVAEQNNETREVETGKNLTGSDSSLKGTSETMDNIANVEEELRIKEEESKDKPQSVSSEEEPSEYKLKGDEVRYEPKSNMEKVLEQKDQQTTHSEQENVEEFKSTSPDSTLETGEGESIVTEERSEVKEGEGGAAVEDKNDLEISTKTEPSREDTSSSDSLSRSEDNGRSSRATFPPPLTKGHRSYKLTVARERLSLQSFAANDPELASPLEYTRTAAAITGNAYTVSNQNLQRISTQDI
ncbi:glutamate-rich protein 3-like [Megalops cyprinoides]|uniref:glutamate-rich protein 3-like n=1 Tax=Megalops cyprinoides TaxID=118141 RepID=UPI00186442DB|nr:glutamate-rich protein 3-like [Megalops cyprinoides]